MPLQEFITDSVWLVLRKDSCGFFVEIKDRLLSVLCHILLWFAVSRYYLGAVGTSFEKVTCQKDAKTN